MVELLGQKPLETHVQQTENDQRISCRRRSKSFWDEIHKCLCLVAFLVLLAITLSLLSRCGYVWGKGKGDTGIPFYSFFAFRLPHSYISALSGCLTRIYICNCFSLSLSLSLCVSVCVSASVSMALQAKGPGQRLPVMANDS